MATLYINADTGNDSTGAGTSVSPWLTMHKAVTSASGGDTIIFQKSTNHFAWTDNSLGWLNKGSLGLTMMSSTLNPLDAIVDAAGASALFDARDGGTYSVTGLTFQDSTTSSDAFIVKEGTMNFTNCIFKNLYAGPGAGDGLFLAFNLGSTFGRITLTGCAFVNIVKNPSGSGGYIFCASASGGFITLVNCSLYVAPPVAFLGLLRSDSGSSVTTLKNCILQNAGAAMATGTPTNSDHNDYFGWSSHPSGVGDIAVDPLYVDAANANLNLRPTSPCIDAGTL